MPNYLHRTTKQGLRSIASADLPEPVGNYIEDPDYSAVEGQPRKYWVISGDNILLANTQDRVIIDAAETAGNRDRITSQFDQDQNLLVASLKVLLQEINILRSNAGLPQRSGAQLKAAIRSKLDG